MVSKDYLPDLRSGSLLGEATLAGAPAEALRKAAQGEGLVPTAVFQVGEDRRLGFALAVPGSTLLVYAERNLAPPGAKRTVTSDDAFSELNGTLYAGGRADPDQVVLTSGDVARSGRRVSHPVRAGSETWLLVVSPRWPLLGSWSRARPGCCWPAAC